MCSITIYSMLFALVNPITNILFVFNYEKWMNCVNCISCVIMCRCVYTFDILILVGNRIIMIIFREPNCSILHINSFVLYLYELYFPYSWSFRFSFTGLAYKTRFIHIMKSALCYYLYYPPTFVLHLRRLIIQRSISQLYKRNN